MPTAAELSRNNMRGVSVTRTSTRHEKIIFAGRNAAKYIILLLNDIRGLLLERGALDKKLPGRV
jgi:hypothetical protein